MDLYDDLNLSKGATEKEIKDAYRKLSRIHHPDMETGDPEKFRKINIAYTTLSNPEKRRLYDEQGVVDNNVVTIDDEAKSKLTLLASKWLDERLNGTDTTFKSYANEMLNTFHKNKKIQDTLLQSHIRRANKALESIKHPDKNNVVYLTVTERIRQLEQAKYNNDREEQVSIKMRSMLNKFIEENVHQRYETVRFSSASTFTNPFTYTGA